MHFGVRFTPSVSTGALGQVYALALSLSPVLEVVTRYLGSVPAGGEMTP
ncbi:hypothetical protein ALQ05_200323 [Pseudomonas amygdali pv. mori]|uniref:Uncharacterized protein n=1 Tax=Pseudomonas amygdali pv. mori TaxID=34065 RepID=A0A3M4L0J6_PSEA0|nr:hypothetical protein ALQ05_200323 [Pseudomonas amygdali pv. mori]